MEVHNMNIDEYLGFKGTSREELKDDAEKMAGHFSDLNKAKSDYINSELANKASKEDVIELQKGLNALKDEQMNALNKALKAQGLQIQKLSAGERAETQASFKDEIREALKANLENLKTLKNGSKGQVANTRVDFATKAVGTMTLGANVSGGNIPVEDRIEGLNIIPSRRVRFLDVMSKRATSSNVVSWVYQSGKEGTAGQTTEGLVKNQIDFDLVVANENVKKSTAFIKVSTEMLDDIAWIESEINNELMRRILKVVEVQAYSGDGTGNNHNGVRTIASAFVAGSFALAVDNANIVDVLAIAANQIKVAQKMDAEASSIFMHPTDLLSLKLVKLSATDKRYVERLIQVGSTLFMDGIPIIESTLITVGEYLIGDFRKALLVTRQGMRFDIGLDDDDFTKNLRTILVEWRGLTIVKNNDRSAFVAGVFATDIAALETV